MLIQLRKLCKKTFYIHGVTATVIVLLRFKIFNVLMNITENGRAFQIPSSIFFDGFGSGKNVWCKMYGNIETSKHPRKTEFYLLMFKPAFTEK